MIYPVTVIKNTTLVYLPSIRTGYKLLYLFLITGVGCLFLSLTFIYIDVSVKIIGITRQVTDQYDTSSGGNRLIGECYVPTKDVIALRPGQTGRCRFEAFNYNSFSTVTSKIISIDNDFVVIDNTPFVKVKCMFNSACMYTKNGFPGRLRQGLTFQASFIIANRSIWQLLFDNPDSWLVPVDGDKKNIAGN